MELSLVSVMMLMAIIMIMMMVMMVMMIMAMMVMLMMMVIMTTTWCPGASHLPSPGGVALCGGSQESRTRPEVKFCDVIF